MKEFPERFDVLIERVENGEHIGIMDENGKAAVMIPAYGDLIRIHTEENNEAQ